MELILHIGMPKTGTSALQDSLRATRALRRHGILYPAGKGLPGNHNLLVCGFTEAARLPRIFKQAYGGDTGRIARDLDAFLAAIGEQVAKVQPKKLILSSEMLFRRADKIGELKAMLGRFSDDIRVVAYVRSPAGLYASQAQQVLKASSRVKPLQPVSYRAELEAYGQLTDKLEVVAYERAKLRDADVTRDFLHRVAPGFEGPVESKTSNETISAEGMDILQSYRAGNHADADSVFSRDTGLLRRAIAALDPGIEGFARPRLRERVRDYLNTASVDLLWLRDRFGIVFSDVEYDRIAHEIDPPPPPKRVAGICVLDRKRRERLAMALLHHLAGQLVDDAPIRFKSALKRAV